MEPENNMGNKTPEVAEMAAEEVVVTEEKPVMNEAPKEAPKDDIVFNDKPNKKTGMILCMILLFLIAAGGVGFGVWAWMEKDKVEKDLAIKITETSGRVTEMITDKITSVNENGTVTEITDTNVSNNYKAGPYIDDGYFYVPEWRLKFKIPSDLANYGYAVDYDTAHTGYTLPVIGFTAMLKSDELQNAQVRYYDDIETCAIVNVSKEPGTWDTKSQINGIIKQFDDYALLIWNHSSHDSCDYDLHIDEVEEKIQTMFQNPENY